MTKKEILEMTGLSEEEFYQQYPTQESWTESYKKGGWIQKATASIKKRGTEGVCTGSKFGGSSCPPGSKRYNLAKTFRKMAKSRKKEDGGMVDMYAEGGKIPTEVLRSRLESHMSPNEAQSYINSYGDGGQLPVDLLEARMKASGASQNEINAYKAQHYAHGGLVDVYQLMGMPTPSMYGMGGDVMMEDYGRGGMIKRKDGSYSRRGLWDNIRTNKGSGKKPTAEMLKQEKKIRAAEKKEYGGMVNTYGMGGPTHYIPSYAFGNVQSKNTTYNHGFGYGGMVPTYGKGGFLDDVWTGVKDVGIAAADNTLSVVNPDIIKESAYSDTGFGDAMKGYSSTMGTFINKAAPAAANILLPGVGGMAVSAAQNIGGNFVESDPERMKRDSVKIAGGLGQLGSMATSFMNPIGAAGGVGNTVGGGSNIATATGGMPMFAAMGGQVNYPQGLRKNMGNMPIFAEGGMTGNLTQINVEKGELLTDKNGKIVTEYRGGGMVPHPEEGMDERGTVPAQEGMFVITKAQAENYKKAMKNNDKVYADSIRNNIAFDKARKEAKEQQLAVAEEQKASKAMNRMMAKYGGAIQRMYAKGGMIPMYDEGSRIGGISAPGPRTDAYANYMNLGDSNYMTPMSMLGVNPSMFNLSIDSPEPVKSTYTYTENPYNQEPFNPLGNRLSSMLEEDYGNTSPYKAQVQPSTWDQSPNYNPNLGKKGPGFGSNISNEDIYTAMSAAPIAWNAIQAMRKRTKVPSFAMDTNLVAPQLTDRQGKREITEMANLGKYNARQIGGSGILPALTNLATNRMKTMADYRENLDTKNAMLNFDAAAKRKAYEQFNVDAAMKRYMLQAQADAVPTQYASAAAEGLGKMGDTRRYERMSKDYIDRVYPYLNKSQR